MMTEGQPDLKQAKKQISKVGLVAFIGSLLILAGQYAATFIADLIAPDLMTDTNISLVVTMVPMYLIAMPLLMLMLSRLPGEKIAPKKMKPGHLVLAFFMCYALMYLSNLVGVVLTTVIGFLKGSAVQNALVDTVTNINPILNFLIVVIIAPVMEELIFRKFFIEKTVKFGQGVAIFISAFMFGMYHGNLNQLVYAFTLGLCFGFIYVKTGKLIYTIILHMVINFMGSIVGIYILELINMEALVVLSTMTDPEAIMKLMLEVLPGLMVLMVYFLFLIGVVITGVVLLLVNRKKYVLEKGEVQLPKGKRFTTIFLNVGMLLFVIFWTGTIILQLFR